MHEPKDPPFIPYRPPRLPPAEAEARGAAFEALMDGRRSVRNFSADPVPRSLIERKSEYRDTLVKRGATLGANCTIVCGTTIGEFAFVGAGAVINKDVKPYALMVGVPARQVGWMSEYGEQIPLPVEGKGEYTCPHTGQQYRLNDQTLERISK